MNGFIIKNVENIYSVSIEYEILPYNHTLEEVVGMRHRDKIKSEMSSKKKIMIFRSKNTFQTLKGILTCE